MVSMKMANEIWRQWRHQYLIGVSKISAYERSVAAVNVAAQRRRRRGAGEKPLAISINENQ
jgi:hypothetical protein